MTTFAYEEHAMLDIESVATQLNVSTATIRRLIRRGKLRAYRIGGQLRFKPEEVEAFIESQAVAPGDIADEEDEDSHE